MIIKLVITRRIGLAVIAASAFAVLAEAAPEPQRQGQREINLRQGGTGNFNVVQSPRQVEQVENRQTPILSFQNNQGDDDTEADSLTVLDLLTDLRFATQFRTALGISQVNEELEKGKGKPYTILVPTNAAFAKIPFGELRSIVTDKTLLRDLVLRHVIVGEKILSGDFPYGHKIYPTMGGEYVTVTRDEESKDGLDLVVTSSITSSKIIVVDMEAGDGVVHIVDTVL